MRYVFSFLNLVAIGFGIALVHAQDFQFERYPIGLQQAPRLQLAQLYLQNGEADSALVQLQDVDTLIPNGAYACFLKAQALDGVKRYGEAAEWYRRAARLSVELRLSARIEAFRSYGLEGMPVAKRVLKSLLKDYPAHNDVYYFAGQYYGEREYYDTARVYLEQAVRILPWNYENHLLLAQVYFMEDKLPQAALAYATAVALQPQNRSSLEALATVVAIAEKWQSDDYLVYRNKAGAFEPVMAELLPRTLKNHQSAYDIPTELEELLIYEQLLPELKRVKTRDLNPTEQLYVDVMQQIEDDGFLEVFLLHLFSGVQHKRLTARLEVRALEQERMIEVLANRLFEATRLPAGTLPGQDYAIGLRYGEDYATLQAAGDISKRGDPVGDWWTFHDNGYIESQGKMSRLGFEDSTWRFYDSYGNLARKEDYRNGKLEGQGRVFYDNGALKIEANLSAGQLQGMERHYYRNGHLKAEYPYDNDKREGTCMEFHFDGGPKSIMNYEAGKREGLFASYYTNGQEKRTVYYKNDLAEGPVRAFNMQGTLMFEGNFNNGLPTGIWTYYDDWGELSKFVTYEYGIPHGITRTYDGFGRLKSEANYKGGHLDGRVYEFDTTGAIRLDALYERGRLLRYVVKDQAGNVLHEEADQKGTMPYENFDNWGRKKEAGVYINGMRERIWRTYYENGQVHTLTPYKKDKIHGEVLTYTPDGRLLQKETYVEGYRTGEQLTYQGNGQPASAMYMINDTLRGWANHYYANGQLSDRLYYNDTGSPIIRRQYDGLGQLFTAKTLTDTSEWMRIHGGKHVDSINYMTGSDSIAVYYDADRKHLRAFIAHQNGHFVGTQRYYHITGERSAQRPFKYGVKHGPQLRYDARGNLRVRTDYRYGQMDGFSVATYPNGQKRFKAGVQHGAWHGPMTFYDVAGRTTASGEHYKDERHGPWTYYNDAGDAIGTLVYQFGKIRRAICPFDTSQNVVLAQDGRSQQILFYYPDGKRAFEFNTQMNVAHGKMRRYARNGQMLEDGRVVYGDWHSTYKLYDPDGTLRLVERLSYGSKDGYERYYAPNGLLKVDAHYVSNRLHGKRRFYDDKGQRIRTEHYEMGRCYKVEE